jgi:hypothetical protein
MARKSRVELACTIDHGLGVIHRRVSEWAGKLLAGRFLKIRELPVWPPVIFL